MIRSMVSKQAILIVFGALVITRVFVLYLTFSIRMPDLNGHIQHATPTPTTPVVEDTPVQTASSAPTPTPMPAASGNIDEALGVIMSEPPGEAQYLQEGEEDTKEITSDSMI